MPEFRTVEHATVSPTCCFICRTHEGPYVDTQSGEFVINTNYGPQVVQAHCYICFGCARQAGRLAGLPSLEEYEGAITRASMATRVKEQLAVELDAYKDLRSIQQRLVK